MNSPEQGKTYPVKPDFVRNALVNADSYKSDYAGSLEDSDSFWAKKAERLDWFKKWDRVSDWSFEKPVHIKWFEGAELNVSVNCIDRHLKTRANQTAIIWVADDPKKPSKKITYQELSDQVNRFSNLLKNQGVKKGDRVTIYMPMIPEAAFAMLACTRIGAIHSIVFGGFSPEALAGRIEDCESEFVITADEGLRSGKPIPLKKNVDEALKKCKSVKKVLVVKHTGAAIHWENERDVWVHEGMKEASPECKPERMSAEDPLFILYTSGSTGKPKGVLHTTGGYLTYVSLTHEIVFDYHEGDVYWCTADVGWVTGHSYVVYGPLCNGATTLMHEGVPTYPDASRHWQIIDEHKVNIYYTAPTAIRALMKSGNDPVKKTSRKSLRVLGSVGEPINSEAWLWYYEVVGDSRCPIVDTWWQTETGGILMTPLPGVNDLKPGSATQPFFGIEPVIVDKDGAVKEGPTEGMFCMKRSWPGQMRTVYRNHERFEETYFSTFKGLYFSGDGAKRDNEGHYWITGRVDDVINVSGHRLGTAEVESALDMHEAVVEAAVVGYPHDVKGQGIYAYVTLSDHVDVSEETLKKELVDLVRKEIGPIATPDLIQFASALPKTRSGKIMRRILRKIAANEYDQLGDTSTLADPDVVTMLVEGRQNK